jgi:putative transposase
LRHCEGGEAAKEIVREMGITEQTFYTWKRKYAGLGVTELRKLKTQEEELGRLKRLVADLMLDKQIFSSYDSHRNAVAQRSDIPAID